MADQREVQMNHQNLLASLETNPRNLSDEQLWEVKGKLKDTTQEINQEILRRKKASR